MKTLLAFAILAAAPLAASADTTKEDLLKLARAGVSEEVILSFVRSNGPVPKLSSDDLIELKTAGLSDKVLKAILEAGAPKAESTPAPVPQGQESRPSETRELNGMKVVEREVVREVPQTTYVERPVEYVTVPGYSYGYVTTPRYTYSYYPRTYYSSAYCTTTKTYSPWGSYSTTTCAPSYRVYKPCTTYSYSYRPSWYVGWSSSRKCASGWSFGVRW